jgi:hypothetical protein
MKKLLLTAVLLMAFPVLAYSQTNTYTFTLTWQDNATNEDEQLIYRDGTQVGKVGPNITTYKDTVTGTVGNPVCYEVTARNAVGESPKSNRSCMTMPAPKPTIPQAPSGVTTAALSTTSIQLSWADNSDNETGFEIEQQVFNPSGVKILMALANATSYRNGGLISKKTYCYQLRAKGTDGDSAYSNQSCSTTK